MNRVRERRERANLTQEQLADRAGIHPNSVSLIERLSHKPFPRTVERIARALNCTPAEYIGDWIDDQKEARQSPVEATL